MTLLSDLPHLVMIEILKRLDMQDINNLAMVSTSMLKLSMNETIWRKFYKNEMMNLWDTNPLKMSRILQLERFNCVNEIQIVSERPRGQFIWAALITTLENKKTSHKIIINANMYGVLPSWLAKLVSSAKCVELGKCLNLDKRHMLAIADNIAKGEARTIHVKIDGCNIRDLKTKAECKLLYSAYRKLWRVEARASNLNREQNRCLDLLIERDEGRSCDLGPIEPCCN